MTVQKSLFSFILILMTGFCFAKSPNPEIVPKPKRIDLTSGEITVTKGTKIYVNLNNSQTGIIGQDLAAQLRAITDYDIPVLPPSDQSGIHLQITEGDTFTHRHAYKLDISATNMIIRAPRPVGLMYGAQSLRQLFPAKRGQKSIRIPCMEIYDHPRFQYRGYMLDVSRYFMPIELLKRYVDLLALYKFNRFHLHLSDDQGWRLEIKAYPQLTEVGAWQTREDGKTYGGFYTQDEMRELVRYARRKHIMIIPEIEMPGHSAALRASLPILNCDQQPREVYSKQLRQPKEAVCVGRETTFNIIETILTEVVDLFPAPYVHMGGDEAFKNTWENCKMCQAKMKELGLTEVDQLQGYFVQRIVDFLNKKGKTVMGWDEIMNDPIRGNIIIQAWRMMEGEYDTSSTTAKAAEKGLFTITSPMNRWYLNFPVCDKPVTEMAKTVPPWWIKYPLNLADVYSFEPVPPGLAPENEKYIIGGEAPLWTSFTPPGKWVDHQTFPRLLAVAEVLWSSREQKNFDDFYKRVQKQLDRLDALGVSYGPAFCPE